MNAGPRVQDDPALRRALLAWYGEHRRDLPWRQKRDAASDAYPVWISEAMLQQTRVEVVLDYWPRFLERFPDARALAAAPIDDVLAAWSGLGYYRRARSLHAAAKVIVERHSGEFPRTLDEARALPGIGPYTAGAVLSIAYGSSEALVDGNVERVLARIFALEDPRGSTGLGKSTWGLARRLVPLEGAGDWNQALMELGATLCTPTSPSCGECPVASACAARAGGRAAELPRSRPKPAPIDVALEIYVAGSDSDSDGEVVLERRPQSGRMAGLWQPPTVEVSSGDDEPLLFPATLPEGDGFAVEPGQDLFEVRHSITRHRIRARVRRAEVSGPLPASWGRFRSSEALGLPLTGMARKVLDKLGLLSSDRSATEGLFQ